MAEIMGEKNVQTPAETAAPAEAAAQAPAKKPENRRIMSAFVSRFLKIVHEFLIILLGRGAILRVVGLEIL